MLPDRVSNPGPLTYESGALPIALRGPAPVDIGGQCVCVCVFGGGSKVGLRFLFSAHGLMLYICTTFHANILDGIKVTEWTRFSLEKNQRGIIPQILQVELQFEFHVHCLIIVYICTFFHENIFDGFELVSRTRFSYL